MSPAVLELAEAFRVRIIRDGRLSWKPDSPLDHVVKDMLMKQVAHGRIYEATTVLDKALPMTGENSSNFLKRIEILMKEPAR